MATGNWNENNRPRIPGFYNRFKTKAEERIGTGIHGILAMPVKSDWGPTKKVVSIKSEKELKKEFGENMDLTAFRLGRLALLGNPKELLLYRMIDDSAKCLTLTLKNSENTPTDIITLESKYPTTRDFNITVRTNLIEQDKMDLILFEGSKQLFAITALDNNLDEVVERINSNVENIYINAKKIDNATGLLGEISNKKFTGGNDGISSITNECYLEAMKAFESYGIDGFTLDGVTDTSLQNCVKEWVIRNKNEGINIIAFLGGSKEETLEQANSKSKEFNHEDIVNIFCHGYYEGRKYTQAEVAVYVAALGTGQGLGESLCNAVTVFDEVEPRLSKVEIETALNSGTLVLAKDDNDVIIVDDVNTLKNYPDDKSDVFGSIRAVKFLNAVDGDTSLKRKDFVGKVNNDDTGRTVIICALKKYFETLAKIGIIENDFIVEVDKELQENAVSDEFFWRWDATYVDVVKRIYGTGYVRK
ncbi:phage tail sheath subtilisin-like domain-containing protein [Clostridium senegalense]|uniref:phage tail sheath subtilisin-like domain-containing protein n=1 Tax=Clostridium senegalense TaxID=1465809 RepID=UPI000288F4AD|nr:phage tail sheath subtilisin-like domain-containing protein [Clostridium senegalense]